MHCSKIRGASSTDAHPGPGRPDFPGALNLEDISPGMKVAIHRTYGSNGGAGRVQIVLEDPFERESDDWWVSMLVYCVDEYSPGDIATGQVQPQHIRTESLADLGITPYDAEQDIWDQFTFTVHANSTRDELEAVCSDWLSPDVFAGLAEQGLDDEELRMAVCGELEDAGIFNAEGFLRSRDILE